MVVGALLLLLIGGAGYLFATGKLGRREAAYALRDRAQLTFSGDVFASAITPDGKQLAYITRHCPGGLCGYDVEIQDVGGTATHKILTGASAAYGLEWSPDRRNLIFYGTVNGRWGTYLVSALGGAPRYLTSGAAMFWAGGDSLLVAPQVTPDSVFYVKVTNLVGVVADSIRIAGPGGGVTGLSVMPSGRWIVALVVQAGRGRWQVFDRSGKVADQVVNSCTCPGRITNDALWLSRSGIGFESIVRMGIDPENGHLATRQDTLLSGLFNNFSVTADGGTLVIDDGTSDDELWAVSLADGLAGKFTPDKSRLRSSTRILAGISPDGGRVLLGRTLPSTTGQSEVRYSVMPFEGGAETQLNLTGKIRGVSWVDSVTVLYGSQTPTGLHTGLIDVRTGPRPGGFDIPDSLALGVTSVDGGWAWIVPTRDRVVVDRAGKRTEIAVPKWFEGVFDLDADPAGQRLMMLGWNAGTNDSLGVAVVPIDGGEPVMWARSYAEGGSARFLSDGSLLFQARPTQESVALNQVRGPGEIKRLGIIPRPVASVGVSSDLKRALVVERTYHGDAWRSRIVRQ